MSLSGFIFGLETPEADTAEPAVPGACLTKLLISLAKYLRPNSRQQKQWDTRWYS
jgi:hypothetical protein